MRDNKKILLALLTAVTIFSTYIGAVLAGTGSIRIEPPLPYMSESPAEFTVSVQPPDTACDPIILLVMTDSCYQGLNDIVKVTWGVSREAGLCGWQEKSVNGEKIPDFASNGAKYTVASLKDHLQTTESIWYASVAILDGDIVPGETYQITVHLDSDHPEMLVYIMGKSDCDSSVYDMTVPPTIPGFVVPEIPVGTVISLLTMIGSAVLYKFKHK